MTAIAICQAARAPLCSKHRVRIESRRSPGWQQTCHRCDDDHRGSHASNGGQICWPHTEQQRRDQPAQTEGPRESNHHTDPREEKALPHDVDEHAGSIGAERHANADLVAALRNEGGQDAIRPHGGEHQCQAGKEPKELRQEARSLDGFSNDRLHIAKALDWYSRVHFMDHARHSLRQCRCRKGRAQQDVVEWHAPLRHSDLRN